MDTTHGALARLVLVIMMLTLLSVGVSSGWAQKGGESVKPPRDKASRQYSKPSREGSGNYMTRTLERYRTKLEVTDDQEWKVIQERIERLLEAEQDLRMAVYGSYRRRDESGSRQSDRGPGRSRGTSGSRPEADASTDVRVLQKLVDAKASGKEIKPKLARVREQLKQKQENVRIAQEDLRSVLSVRQEAIAVLNGLLQ